MRFSLAWLKDHLETGASAEQIAAKLNAIGLEVESLDDRAAKLPRGTAERRLAASHRPGPG